MTDSILREIAEKVAQEAILQNWKLYALLIGLTLISIVANAFITKYFEKRGESYATKSDLTEILRQLKQTTEVTEQVRAAISHADWLSREWKVLRRTKLEELVQSAISLEQWLNQQRSVWFFGSEEKDPSPPTGHVSMITTLYFPELEQESAALAASQLNAYLWIVNTGRRALDAGSIEEKGVMLTQAATEWSPLYGSVMNAISQVKQKASVVMQEMQQPKGSD